MWGPNSAGESTVRRWFQEFQTEDFNLEDSCPKVVEDEILKNLMKVDPTQTVMEIANELRSVTML